MRTSRKPGTQALTHATLTIGMTLLIAACGSIGAGVESEETQDAGLVADAAGPSCAEAEACAPAIPEGWSGPVTLVADQPCPDEMPDELLVSHTSLEVPETSCDCSCGSPEGVSCSGPVVLRAREAICKQEDFFAPAVSFPIGASVNVQGHSARSWATDPSAHPLPQVTGGVCAPIAEVSIPEPSWKGEIRTCAHATDEAPSACEEDGACAFAGAPLCIYQEGDSDCPAGPYSERTVTYRDIDDTRGCSSCDCGPPTGLCDGPVIFFIQNTFTFGVFDLADSCIDLAFTPTHGGHGMTGTPASESAECQATASTPTGTAVPAGAVTTCCLAR